MNGKRTRGRKAPWIRKTAALLMAGAVCIGSVCPAGAADSYTQHEREALKETADTLTKEWEKSMEEYREGSQAGMIDLSLQLAPSGRSLLGMFAPVDISWLENVGLTADGVFASGDVGMKLGLYLNDTGVATLEFPISIAQEMAYMRIPELSEQYLGVPLEFEGENTEQSKELLLKVYDPEFAAQFMPDGSTAGELLERYGNLVLDYVEDGETYEETVQVSDVEETFQVYEGKVMAAGVASLLGDIMRVARDDAQIKEILEKMEEMVPETGDLYGEFQKALDENLADWEEMNQASEGNDTDGNYITTKIWVDAEGETAGRQLAVYAEGENAVNISWLSTSKEDRRGFFLSTNIDGSPVELKGSGTVTNGLLSGDYVVSVEDTDMFHVAVSDYFEDKETGDFSGSYLINMIIPDDPDAAEELQTLENFALRVDAAASGSDDSSELNVTLLIAGEELGTIRLAGAASGEMELTALPEESLDPDNEEDMQIYMQSVNTENLLDNFRKAGVPDEVIQEVTEMLFGQEDSTEADTENGADAAQADGGIEAEEETEAMSAVG